MFATAPVVDATRGHLTCTVAQVSAECQQSVVDEVVALQLQKQRAVTAGDDEFAELLQHEMDSWERAGPQATTTQSAAILSKLADLERRRAKVGMTFGKTASRWGVSAASRQA